MSRLIPLTKAAEMAKKYQSGQESGLPTDPALNPAWNDREKVPSPPRRAGEVPRVAEDGVDTLGRKKFQVTGGDGGGSTPPKPEEFGEDAFRQSCSESLYVPPAVQESPTFTSSGNQEGIDKQALDAAAQISRLVETAPDEALKMFRLSITHPTTGFLVFGHLTEDVQKDLSGVFFRIITRKPWVFQVCRMLLSLQGNSSLPKIFRSCCSLATNHAFLTYADIVPPFGRLDEISRAQAEVAPSVDAQVEADDLDKGLAEAFLDVATEIASGLTTESQQNDADGEITAGVPSGDPLGDAMRVVAEEALHAASVDSPKSLEVEAVEEDSAEYLTDEELVELTVDELDELTKPDDSPEAEKA